MEASSAELRETEEGFQPIFFDPRPLKNLRLVDEVESLSPIMDLKVTLGCPPLPMRVSHGCRWALPALDHAHHTLSASERSCSGRWPTC